MFTVYAKQRGTTALYRLTTTERMTESMKVCRTYQACNPEGWTVVPTSLRQSLTGVEPSPEVAVLLAKWQADADAGVDKYAERNELHRQDEIRRHENRKRLVEAGHYKWSDFDITDEDDDEGEED